MTYRQQRKGQYQTMLIIAVCTAMIATGAIARQPWLFMVFWVGYELLLIMTKTHRCWRDDINLDDKVPLDRDGRPTV